MIGQVILALPGHQAGQMHAWSFIYTALLPSMQLQHSSRWAEHRNWKLHHAWSSILFTYCSTNYRISPACSLTRAHTQQPALLYILGSASLCTHQQPHGFKLAASMSTHGWYGRQDMLMLIPYALPG